ncbi:protein kinase domain protein [Ichthyophthirius multifiliis]|uniref:mitogen-activated protein kinase kinase n=1 Tax=Ichthyophthirius multifiliis TaxID=5932 RepID=G0R5U8_ICHMU|nr:protein kinase domain protein [Ichthyophthirius multifiliis]EGR27169.1 protein kinase domain protein [Ichthyophthirius multifiliis]|eukprot:XP_004024053.1 protein kinase domain protein [Ichthyophthirius multifiliis]
MKKGKKKPPQIQVEDELEKSKNSEIGSQWLDFINNGIKISNDGIRKGNLEFQFDKNDVVSTGKCIGEGVACQVEEGIYKPLNIKVAIKKIKIYDREKRRQLESDIKILLNNAEKNTQGCYFFVKMYGAFYDEGQVKIVLELMDVGSFKAVINILKIAQVQQNQILIPENILSRICQQVYCLIYLYIVFFIIFLLFLKKIKILIGLMHLHIIFKQVHRDIKPENILMNSKGEVKLTDFGVAKELDQTDQKLISQRGTTAYMSPERINGDEYSFPSDIWSFGIVIYEMITGKYPFQADKTIIQLHQLFQNMEEQYFVLPKQPNFSNSLRNFIQQCLVIDPNKRSSAIELLVHPFINDNLSQDNDIQEWLNDIKYKYMQKQSQNLSQE